MPSPEYYEKNKERIKARVKAYNDLHRAEKYARNKRWREANPEKFAATNYRNYIKRRDRKREERKKQNEDKS